MRTIAWTKGAGLGIALVALAAVAGCDTNYYGDSGASRGSTTAVTTAPAPLPPSATTTTTVQPNPDGSVTTTERTYRTY